MKIWENKLSELKHLSNLREEPSGIIRVMANEIIRVYK